jgi:hypothetical protein
VRGQFVHAVDLMPTILAAAGLEVPESVDGVTQQPVDGVDLLAMLEDPAAPEAHHTQYFEMMGSRAVYHMGWKATTDHVSWGVLDEERLASGSRDFDEDRWELFDLTTDFSEATDRAAVEPERLASLVALWGAEAARNNVLPISDQLADRFAGFVPPPWPAGTVQVYRPGGGGVADESLPLLWGGFRMTADVDTGSDRAHGVVFALGDHFGGWGMYLLDGCAHFTFARASGPLELVAPSPVPSGRHALAVFYEPGAPGAPGRMVLLVDDAEVDEVRVEGHLPLALQHGGAHLRLGHDTGFPVSTRYEVPAPFSGTVHQVRIEAPGELHPDPADEVRAALHAD